MIKLFKILGLVTIRFTVNEPEDVATTLNWI
jgi:hypothetical protein